MQNHLTARQMLPEDFAFLLLAQICRTDTEKLLTTFTKFNYTPRRKKKRSGGYRYYFVPQDDLGSIQKSLLENFLYQIDRRQYPYFTKNYYGTFQVNYERFFSDRLHGFTKRKSYVDNARKHTEHYTRFILRLDLKNAFPSITYEMVKEVLQELIRKDIEEYWNSSLALEKEKMRYSLVEKVLNEAGPRPKHSRLASKRKQGIVLRKIQKWEEKVYGLFDKHDPENLTWSVRDGIACGKMGNYKKKYGSVYGRYPLFPARRCKEFRELVREGFVERRLDDFVNDVLESFLALVMELVTYQDKLVQGAATSGFLFMLVMHHKQIIPGIQKLLHNRFHLHRTISMYADDITIGFEERPTKETIRAIVDYIESHGLKINHKKTKVWDRRQIAPVITGLRLIRKEHRGDTIDPFIELRKSKEVNYSGAMQRKREGGIWYEDAISIPKKLQRKMRAVFYQASTLSEVPENLLHLAAGYKGMIVQVYGKVLSDIPKGIGEPLRAYLQRFDKSHLAASHPINSV